MPVTIITADYQNETHATHILTLLDRYARDSMGGGEPLTEYVKNNLINQLAHFPTAFTLLAFQREQPIGIANCFFGFSTFYGQKLINIHDFAVEKSFRGQGISQLLLNKIEEIATQHHCCKITLEVLSNNHIAKAAYQKFGFSDYQLNEDAGHALYWQKILK